MKNNNLAKPFLIILLVLSIFACYYIFRPFLTEIIIAAVLVSFFYRPFKWLVAKFKGRRVPAALLMCVLVLLIVIVPIINLLIYSGKQSVAAYADTVAFVENLSKDIQGGVLSQLDFMSLEDESVKSAVIEITKNLRDWLGRITTVIVKETTGFLFSLVLIVLTMFFFFVDGERMLQKLKFWSPLPDKYDLILFDKFRETSYVAVVSTFATALVQGLIGGIGFAIVGLPAFYAGVLIAFFSLIPYIGAMIIYVPVGVYLILAGDILQGIFILVYGAVIIGNTDNVMRVYLLQGKSKINPIFVLFALMGGLTLFGFWGLVLGPLILALVSTVFHLYELEYGKQLQKD